MPSTMTKSIESMKKILSYELFVLKIMMPREKIPDPQNTHEKKILNPKNTH